MTVLSLVVLNSGKRLVKKAYTGLHLHFFPTITIMADESPRQITLVADTWREKFSNVNVVMRYYNIAV